MAKEVVVVPTAHWIQRSILDEPSVNLGAGHLKLVNGLFEMSSPSDIIHFTRGVLKVSTAANDYKPETEYGWPRTLSSIG